MLISRQPWQTELAIIDRTMKAISSISDPEKLVNTYWESIGELLPINDYLSASRRDLPSPQYRITRSSRFTEHLNPWLHRDRLPLFSTGLVGEIIYANAPVIITNLADRLAKDDPAYEYLQGFHSAVALPHYENGQSLNVTISLLPPGMKLDPTIIPMLHWQSGLFGRGTQNLVLKNQLADALASLDRELQIVGHIQRSLLPQKLPDIPGFQLAAYYRTSARAGGDYYDFFPLADNSGVGIFIADVSGHGTPAAVLMAITHAIAHAQPGTHTPPAALLQFLNDQLARFYTRDGTFVTAFYATLNSTTRQLTYARAGHNPPRLLRHQKILSLDQSPAFPLGIESQSFEQVTLQLQPDDLLLFYTDGITEAFAPQPISQPNSQPAAQSPTQLFTTSRLDDLLLQNPTASPESLLNTIQATLAAFTQDAPPTDDQTLIALKCSS